MTDTQNPAEYIDLEYTVNPEALLTAGDVRTDRAEVGRLKNDVEQLKLIVAELEAELQGYRQSFIRETAGTS